MESGALSALRTMRVLRPLRVVNRFPRLRILVRLLMDIIPMLANVLLLCIFLFTSMGIIGVQLWRGVLRNGCYNDEGVLYTLPTQDATQFYLCSFENTGKGCPSDYSSCLQESPNFYGGMVSFDNIGKAFLTIFQVITLEEWSSVMYALQDAYSFWVWPYFIVLIVLGSWFAVNLALVVIATQFKNTKKRELELQSFLEVNTNHPWETFVISTVWLLSFGRIVVQPRNQHRPRQPLTAEEQSDLHMVREVFDLFDSNHDGTISVQELKTALQALDAQLSAEELSTLAKSIDRDGNGSIDFAEFHDLMTGGDIFESVSGPLGLPSAGAAREGEGSLPLVKEDQHSATVPTFAARVQSWAKTVVDHPAFVAAVIVCIVVNTGALAAQHKGQSVASAHIAESINDAMAICFLVEIIIRIVSVGAINYFLNGYNALDALLVAIGIIELFLKDDNLSILKVFRLLRLFKLARCAAIPPPLLVPHPASCLGGPVGAHWLSM
jgi:hypothetical protein